MKLTEITKDEFMQGLKSPVMATAIKVKDAMQEEFAGAARVLLKEQGIIKDLFHLYIKFPSVDYAYSPIGTMEIQQERDQYVWEATQKIKNRFARGPNAPVSTIAYIEQQDRGNTFVVEFSVAK